MAGKLTEIGISVYPDFDNQEVIKKELDEAKALGYTRVFTSIQLGDLGFENTSDSVDDNFKYLFDYAKELGMICHVDINDTMLKQLGASVDNLKPVYDLNIPIIRLDGGFSYEEIAELTNNPYGIIIEENLSGFNEIEDRIKMVAKLGNVHQYYGCHNFFPRNDTGISLENALKAAELFESYGCKCGIFIGSLYSQNDLNAQGSSVPTIESHRYLPSHIQVKQLLEYDVFDYILFGDSHPRSDELKDVSESVVYAKDVIVNEQLDKMHPVDIHYIQDLRVIDIPVFWDIDDQEVIDILETIVFVSRQDAAQDVIRGTESRRIIQMQPHLTIQRSKYAITVDNVLSNRYTGELQIMMKDLPAVRNVNVIGYVKPYATCLLEEIHKGKVAFRLKGKR